MFRCLFYKRSTSLHSKFHMLKNNSFSLTQQKHYSWIYLDIAAFQDFKVSLLATHSILSRPKSKKNNNNKLKCKFEFRLNCKQRFLFHQGTINDIKFMTVDATKFCLCRNPRNCLLSMNKSARRCMFCNESVLKT